MPNQLYYVQNTTNLGEAVNPAIFQDVLGIKVDSATHTKADIFGIGNFLEKAFIHNKPNSGLFRNFWRNRKKYAPDLRRNSSSLAADFCKMAGMTFVGTEPKGPLRSAGS